MKLIIILLLTTSCATSFSYLDCIAKSQRLGVDYDKALLACELDRESSEKHVDNFN